MPNKKYILTPVFLKIWQRPLAFAEFIMVKIVKQTILSLLYFILWYDIEYMQNA